MAFYLHRDGKPVHFPINQLRNMARDGDLRQDEYIYDDEKKEWIGAALVPDMSGAWNIEESEATVAMEIPPEFFAEAEAAAAAEAFEAEPEPEEALPPMPSSPPPAPMAPAPAAAAPMQMMAPEPKPVHRGGGGGGGGGGGRGGGSRGRGGNLPHGVWISPIKVLILMVVTCGFYGLFWIYKRMVEINTFLGREEIKPMFFFLGFMCGPLFLLVLWKMCKALPEMGRVAGVEIADRAVLLMLLAFCFPYGFYFLTQQDLNTIWEAAGATPPE